MHGEVKAASVELLLTVCRQVAPVYSLRTESRLLSHAFRVSSSPSNQWAFPLHVGPQSGTPVLWLDSLVPQGDSSPVWAFSLFYIPLRNNQSYNFFPSCELHGNLSWAHICMSSASLRIVFCENCSTGRSIFDVFVGGCEHHVLLFHHLDPILYDKFNSDIFNFYKFNRRCYYHLCLKHYTKN